MSTTALESAAAVRRLRTHRLIRKLHVWIGAWGALAAVLFGVTGFLQNHRALLKLPQGSSIEVARVELPVPSAARNSPEALRAWLASSQHLSFDPPRAPPAVREGRGRWMLTGGNARTTVQAEYSPGSETVVVRTNEQSPLAVIERLHKGVGGGVAWILLSDSFALGMVALGLSGLVMWSRGRTLRQMVFSIVGTAAVVLGLIGLGAIV
ncbi:MAG TPA: PepSY-associated TM helix domain-containing protein [Steroidobacteraceae bacterium]|nr:PepSY-associated TM helix domain-containing protein [Steroidobacteraceae bacterium]